MNDGNEVDMFGVGEIIEGLEEFIEKEENDVRLKYVVIVVK